MTEIKFLKFPENIPPIEKDLLVKYKETWGEKQTICYYMFRYIKNDYGNLDSEYVFEEAGGEQYFKVDPKDVIGWLAVDELNKVEVMKKKG